MNYFVTGGTGFIGRFLIERLLERPDARVWLLVRSGSEGKFEALCERLNPGANRLIAVTGDICDTAVVPAAGRRQLPRKIDHVFHLAAAYDMNMDDATADRVNRDGTRHLVAFVNSLSKTTRLHHISSVAVAGSDWQGRFTETLFDQGQSLSHPYYRTKFEAEAIVRAESQRPFRIYRPGIVVGDSRTGEMDKVDGPYYFFKAIQRISQRMPKWVPLLGIEGGQVPLCPVDYVADAIDHLAHADGQDGQCFHLVQRNAPTVGDLLQLLLHAAHGPDLAAKLRLPPLARGVGQWAQSLSQRLPVAAQRALARTIGVPAPVLGYAFNLAVFDDRRTRAALKGSGISCPDIRSYVDRLWRYWELFLDFDTEISESARKTLKGRVILITGASSGIGLRTAQKLASSGARVILVARSVDKLEEARAVIQKAGGDAHVYPCDLTDLEAIDRMTAQVLKDLGHVDVLINNAGRSIRRAVFESFKRFHDFQRTMDLNYFGSVRLIMNLLPSMAKRRQGHIINISSIGVLANAARFSAYVASKAALDAYTRCLSAEVRALNIHTTAIYMPLVRTPMIAPTKFYDYVPTWSPDDAADTVIKAVVERPKFIATPLGTAASLSYAIWPKLNDYVLSMGFRLFPPTGGAGRSRPDQIKPTLTQALFANLFRGEHW